MSKDINQWLKLGWLAFPGITAGTIAYVFIFNMGLAAWQKLFLVAALIVVIDAFLLVLLTVPQKWIARRREAKQRSEKLRNAWDALFENNQYICGELELHTRGATTRAFLMGLRREKDEILFLRDWVATSHDRSWRFNQRDSGTEFIVSAIDGEGPVYREDETYFINLPDGAAVLYPAGHSKLLRLRASISLEPDGVKELAH